MGLEVFGEIRPIPSIRTASMAEPSIFSDPNTDAKELTLDPQPERCGECVTPKSPVHVLRPPPSCPPPPRKPRPPRRKLCPPAMGYCQVPDDLASVFLPRTETTKKIRAV